MLPEGNLCVEAYRVTIFVTGHDRGVARGLLHLGRVLRRRHDRLLRVRQRRDPTLGQDGSNCAKQVLDRHRGEYPSGGLRGRWWGKSQD